MVQADAENLEKHERWSEAVAAWRWLARAEANAYFTMRAALAAESGGMFADAEQLFREVIAQHPEAAHGYIGLGVLLQQQDRLEEARQLLEHGLAIEERSEGLTILGSVQRRLGDHSAAQVTLRRSLAISPDDEETHLALARALMNADPAAALWHCRRALELDPHLLNGHALLGEALWRVRQFSDAHEALRIAIAENPDDSWSHFYLGHTFELQGDLPAAKGEFLAATAHAAEVGVFWKFLADVNAALGDRVAAERHYLKALSLGLHDPSANARYGILLKQAGEIGRAKAYLERALKLEPNRRDATDALRDLEKAD